VAVAGWGVDVRNFLFFSRQGRVSLRSEQADGAGPDGGDVEKQRRETVRLVPLEAGRGTFLNW